MRYVPRAGGVIDGLLPGDALYVVAQPDNPVNPDALLVTRDDSGSGGCQTRSLATCEASLDPSSRSCAPILRTSDTTSAF